MTGTIDYRQTRGVAVLTLSVPRRRNVLSAELVGDLEAAMDRAEADPRVRAVVVTGAGSAFCAGAELSTLAHGADGAFAAVTRVYDGFLRVLRSPLPAIAAVNGPAVGAGFNLALACDVRLAGVSARFESRFTDLRLHPGGGHAWLLTQAVGRSEATMACLFGTAWDAEQARQRRLVAAVHPDSELLDAAINLGARLEPQDPEFVRTLIATIRTASGIEQHPAALAAETAAQRWSMTLPAFLKALQRRITEKNAARRSGGVETAGSRASTDWVRADE